MPAQSSSAQEMTDTIRTILENARIAVEAVVLCAQDAGKQDLVKAAQEFREPMRIRLAEANETAWDPAEPGIYETLEGFSRIARDLWNPVYKDLAEWITLKVVSDAGKALWYQKALEDPKHSRQLEDVQSLRETRKALEAQFLRTEPKSAYQKMLLEKNRRIFGGVAAGIEAIEGGDQQAAHGVAEIQATLKEKLPDPAKQYASVQELLEDLSGLKHHEVPPPTKELIALCEHASRYGTRNPELTKSLAQSWKKASPLLPDSWTTAMSETISGIASSTRYDTLSCSAAEAMLEFAKPEQKFGQTTESTPSEIRKEYQERRESAESDLDRLLNASPALKASLSQKEYAVVRERLVRAMATQKKGDRAPGDAPVTKGPISR